MLLYSPSLAFHLPPFPKTDSRVSVSRYITDEWSFCSDGTDSPCHHLLLAISATRARTHILQTDLPVQLTLNSYVTSELLRCLSNIVVRSTATQRATRSQRAVTFSLMSLHVTYDDNLAPHQSILPHDAAAAAAAAASAAAVAASPALSSIYVRHVNVCRSVLPRHTVEITACCWCGKYVHRSISL